MVNHENIVPLLGVTSDFDRPYTPCLVTPYYINGNIISYLKTQPAVNKLALLAQVAAGLSYLHSISIIHGDVKGSNILINDNSVAVISDFGLSNVIQASVSTTGSPSEPSRSYPHFDHDHHETWEAEKFNPVTTDGWRWKAPELMVAYLNETYTLLMSEAIDIYAFAMTAIEILTASIPFSHIKSDASVIVSVVAGGRPKRDRSLSIKDEIWVMLERCWDVEPSRRPSMAAVYGIINLRATYPAVQRARL